MEIFSEDHSKQLLSQEWLTKVDPNTSTPYLFKFHASTADLSCVLIITDTKNVWAEVLSGRHALRRWRECNPNTSFLEEGRGDTVKSRTLGLLSTVHTIGGIADVPFEIVRSADADLAFELDCDCFKWRWDSYLLGPKTSAEILSKHLILPMISVTHMAFYSADPVSELAEKDLENLVDKVSRTARRNVDIHVKHAISKPRVATTLQRMTAMFNFSSSLLPIISEAEKPDLEKQFSDLCTRSTASERQHQQPRPAMSEEVHAKPSISGTVSELGKQTRKPTPAPAQGSGSATEESDDNLGAVQAPGLGKGKEKSPSPFSQLGVRAEGTVSSTAVPRSDSKAPAAKSTASEPPGLVSDSDSPPIRPVKKSKVKHALESDSDLDYDSGGKESNRAARPINNGGNGSSRGAGVTRGVRQPIKRGAKRF